MFHFRNLFAVGAICAAVAGPVSAQDSVKTQIPLAGLVSSSAVTRTAQTPLSAFQAGASPLQNLSIRGGYMATPRGAGIAGIDFDLPTLSLGQGGMRGRLDADVLFKANFHGINTAIPVTINQISYTPSAAGHSIYYGGGVGAVLGGHVVFDAKLIAGTELSKKLGAEVNVHFTEKDTLLCLLARFHL